MNARGFCWTINNPNEWDKIDVNKCQEHRSFKYLCYGNETGEGGTFHLQGYIHFLAPVGFTAVKKLLPRAHIEKRRGTVEQAISYCKKDGDFIEYGAIPESSGDSTIKTWNEIIKRAKSGDLEWIEENHPKVYLRYINTLRGLRVREPVILSELVNEWWFGKTGVGKSRRLWEEYPVHFKKELNKWWCGYRDEDVVAIEEWSPKNECTGSMLKIWADRYPFTGQVKGGALQGIRPKKIIVLSNYTIKECFPDPRDHEPLLRRFKQVEFKSLIDNILDDF